MSQRVIIIGFRFENVSKWDKICEYGMIFPPCPINVNNQYRIYLLSYPGDENFDVDEKDIKKMNIYIEEIIDWNKYEEILILLHRAPWKSEYLPYVGNNVNIKPFGGGTKKIYDFLEKDGKEADYVKLCKEENWDSIWDAYYIGDLRVRILSPLIPLHLSLQAFWGISRDDNVQFVQFGARKTDGDDDVLDDIHRKRNELNLRDGNNELQEELLSSFPNSNAFLLVDEAEWDFYTDVFDKVIKPNKDGDSLKNDDQTIAEMLKKIDENKFEHLIESFNELLPDEYIEMKIKLESNKDSKAWFSIPVKGGEYINVYANTFVGCLREIAAILANTYSVEDKNCYKDGEVYFGYNGRYPHLRNRILKWLSDDFQNPHCKLPKNDDKPSNQYDELKRQIVNWGIEKAMVVIAGVEELAELMD